MRPLLLPQTPSSVVMVRPHFFAPNPQTASDNAFQRSSSCASPSEISGRAYEEVTRAAHILKSHGVAVHLFEDQIQDRTPDSVFPNNWFSTHAGGHVALYPMYSPNRRRERRADVIELLKARYRVQDVIDYSGLEPDGLFLEGTGAMVLDHIDRVAYTVQSNRANPIALERFATHFNYEPMSFEAFDEKGNAVYHTNVLMCIGTAFAMVGFELIPDAVRRTEIKTRLQNTGRNVIDLSAYQIGEFAGNALELNGSSGRILAISSRALASLSSEQVEVIEKSATIIPLQVPTIELAGGSVRCMLAGIHLCRRDEI
ncbi:arginine deiminase-related protein [Rhodoferax sp. GW822-FHT02A01]|uniref:citrulline utilization hydrolase CtlX n=1 Tax=Rhodoferax sp. GW822-FHT02A01 TaxID=3141537 RepID=UPI00315D89C3